MFFVQEIVNYLAHDRSTKHDQGVQARIIDNKQTMPLLFDRYFQNHIIKNPITIKH